MSTTKTIAASGADYSSVQAWYNANPGGAAGWIGQQTGALVPGATTSFTGKTNSIANFVRYEAASGQRFSGAPFRYNNANGASLDPGTGGFTGLSISDTDVTVLGMQINNNYGYSGEGVRALSTALRAVIDSCIIVGFNGNGAIYSEANGIRIINSLIRQARNGAPGVTFNYSSGNVFVNNILVCASGITGGNGIQARTGDTITNNAVFGFSAFGTHTVVGSNNATDLASTLTGLTASVVNLVYVDQFVGITTGALDFRFKTTGALGAAGATDTTDIPAAIDAIGAARPGALAAWSIGSLQIGFSPPVTKDVEWIVAYNGDITSIVIPGTGPTAQFDNAMGPDLTYFSSDLTCPSTAADSTHIVVDSSETAASIIGHAIQWKSGNICIALSRSGSTIAVGALIGSPGYSANFGGTPQSGDAYTIFPTHAIFTFGESSAGHSLWALTAIIGDRGALTFSAISSSTSYITIRQLRAFDRALALGDILDNSTFPICVKNTGDHMAVFGTETDNIHFDNMVIWDGDSTGGAPGDGCWMSDNANQITQFTNLVFSKCLLRGDNFSVDTNHFPLSAGENSSNGGAVYNNCVLIGTSALPRAMGAPFTANWCTIINTSSVVLTATVTAASGTTLTFASTALITAAPGHWVGHPGVPIDTYVVSKTGTTVTLSNALTGTVTSGDTVYFGKQDEFENAGGSPITTPSVYSNCAVFGMVNHGVNGRGFTATACATEYTAGISGFTAVGAMLAQFQNAYNVGTTAIDARPKTGNGLNIGTFSGTYPTDIYGTAYAATNPTVGAVQEISAVTGRARILSGG